MDRHYNPQKINKVFAMSAIVLLLSLLALVAKDYNREWKKFQKEFQALEVEKARVKYDLVEKRLATDEEYQALLTEIELAEDEYELTCVSNEELQSRIRELKAKDDLAQQQYKFSKAELDAAKYRYEEAKAHHGESIEAKHAELEHSQEQTQQLKLEAERTSEALAQANEELKDCSARLTQLDRQKRQAASEEMILRRKLEKIDPAEMSMTNQIAEIVRNLPILDLANPTLKIQQVVLKDIGFDVNFGTVPRVERCTTCHLGIDNPDYDNAAQPFKSHPNLDLYVGKDSPHSFEEFGCTTCHGGRPRGTSFDGAAHTPNSAEQEAEWKKKYGWERMALWEEPMHPLKYVEAGCFKCHSGETAIKGAEKLNLGLHLIERAGCYGCHEINKYHDWPLAGPDLRQLASKFSKEWAYQWIWNPFTFRHNTWMPNFFNQSNTDEPEDIARGQQEVHAIVHYLYEQSGDYVTAPLPVKGDIARGEELVSSLGCFACHQKDHVPDLDPTTRDTLRIQHGPNLIGLGTKTSKEWLFRWLKNPSSYHPETRMPDMRLTDQEAADISEYLVQDEQRMEQPIPALDESQLDRIALDFLKSTLSNRQALDRLGEMSVDDKLSFAGEKLIGHYGCYACHEIKGFEDTKPIGTELTYHGNKTPHDLDFGFIHIDHTTHAWFKQKLMNPRIFDKGKIKAPLEKLKMPNYQFTEDEAEAIVTAILGFVDSHPVEEKIKPRTIDNVYIEEGQKIVRQLNCQSCHLIEGQGGAIKQSVVDWLVKYQGKDQGEAKVIADSYSPPNLIGEGAKVQPDWLFKFLHQPTTIRPWLSVRMPTYTFNTAHLNTLIKYFNALDDEEMPFSEMVDVHLTPTEYEAAEKLFSNEYFGCAQCHIVGDQMPSGSPENWAPDFALVKERLKPDWLIDWIKAPNELLPGTKMPTYFDPGSFEESGPPDILGGDENEQIRVLRNYLMTLSDASNAPGQKSAPKKSPTMPVTEPVSPSVPAVN